MHLGRAELGDHQRCHQRQHEALRDVEAGPPQLLTDDRQLGRRSTAAAELLGQRQAEPSHLGEAGDQLGRVGVLVVPLLGSLGRAHPLHEAARGVAQQRLLVSEPEVHESAR